MMKFKNYVVWDSRNQLHNNNNTFLRSAYNLLSYIYTHRMQSQGVQLQQLQDLDQ